MLPKANLIRDMVNKKSKAKDGAPVKTTTSADSNFEFRKI